MSIINQLFRFSLVMPLNTTPQQLPKILSRNFFAYFRISFNQVDTDRLKQVGPDRLCAEWVLKNGGVIRYAGKGPVADYNSLGPTEFHKQYIEEINGTDSSIMDIGFSHLRNCNHIKTINLTRCKHIENESLAMLTEFTKNSLENLTIIECFNITDSGLMPLVDLSNLKSLKIKDLPYVKNIDAVAKELKLKLPENCHIEIEK